MKVKILNLTIAWFLLYALTYSSTTHAANNVTLRSTACIRCHEEIVSKYRTKPHVHTPFLNKKCVVCHVGPVQNRLKPHSGSSAITLTPSPQKKIVYTDDTMSMEHWILIDEDLVNNQLFVDFSGDNTWKTTLKIEAIQPENLPSLTDDHKPPEISDVSHTIKKGLFWEAKITWRTQEPATTEVVFIRSKGLPTHLGENQRYSLDHGLSIYDLKKGEAYQYWVVSRDIFGNKGKIGPFMILEDEFDQSRNQHHNFPQSHFMQGNMALNCTYDLSIVKGIRKLLLHTQCSRPAAVTVASLSHKTWRINAPINHPYCSAPSYCGAESCIRCHLKDQCQHPQGVKLLPGMDRDHAYPLTEAKTVMCATCHAPHGSSYAFLLRRSGGSALCTGCHLVQKRD